MADAAPTGRRFDPLSPAERVAVCAMAQLAFEWQFKDKAEALVSVMLEAVPLMRRDADFDRLGDAAVKFSAARTHVEWTFAAAEAGRAILPILRRDMLHALPSMPERK